MNKKNVFIAEAQLQENMVLETANSDTNVMAVVGILQGAVI